MNEPSDLEEKILARLDETGQRKKLEDFLQLKLFECGWRSQIKAYCQEIVRQQGLNNMTVEDLVTEVSPKARELVPDQIKRELVQQIREFLIVQKDIKDLS